MTPADTALAAIRAAEAENGIRYVPGQCRDLDEIKRRFAIRLDAALTALGWTQGDLHERSGVTRSSVSLYVTRKTRPTVKNIRMMSDAMGIDAKALSPELVELDDERLGKVSFPGRDIKHWDALERKLSQGFAEFMPAAAPPFEGPVALEHQPGGRSTRLRVDVVLPRSVARKIEDLILDALESSDLAGDQVTGA